ncbi:hypothetical protein [Streptomyces sp. DHE17-7]|uniref:hypothetical protein n=1 Tax=Streptomyces sp. DHE17-7 TaxID=2759949 RepID=UPI0022EA82C1|nr:hypothetical protein [Streptomyces sp. DHE17-7]MBJ6618467.1 hypothetical protein [Streptomyces sp. DHE17-7]
MAALVRTTLQIVESVTRFSTPPAAQPAREAKRTEGMFADYRPERVQRHPPAQPPPKD